MSCIRKAVFSYKKDTNGKVGGTGDGKEYVMVEELTEGDVRVGVGDSLLVPFVRPRRGIYGDYKAVYTTF